MQNNKHKCCRSLINFLGPLNCSFLSFSISFLPSYGSFYFFAFACISFAGNFYICVGNDSLRNIWLRRHHTCIDDGDMCPTTGSEKLVLKLKEKTNLIADAISDERSQCDKLRSTRLTNCPLTALPFLS